MRPVIGKRIALSVLPVAGCIAAVVLAQSTGGNFELTTQTIDGGGGAMSGGPFELVATIGQAEANVQTSSGGAFSLTGGFWAAGRDVLFADSFEGN